MKILVMALIGALIGYVTNVLAIKLLFRPIKPSKILKIQGLIPKRHQEIAVSIGEIVEEELLSTDEIIDELFKNTDKQEILQTIKEKLLTLIRTKFKLYMMFASVIDATIDEIIASQGENLLDEMIEMAINKFTNSVNIKKMVEEKILQLDLIEMERIIIKIAKNELKRIELLGGVLGLLIGVVQGVVVMFM